MSAIIETIIPASPSAPAPGDPDAHGQAALLLVESLIHGLIANSVLSLAGAIEIVDTAAEVKVEVASEEHERAAVLARSLALLNAVSQSLGHDQAV